MGTMVSDPEALTDSRRSVPGEDAAFPARDWPALRAGDTAARERFYRCYAAVLLRAIRSWARGLSDAEAEDLLSESFVKAFRHLGDLREAANLEGWLFRLARNVTMDHCRRNGRSVREWSFGDLSRTARDAAMRGLRADSGDVLAALASAEDREQLAALIGQVLSELPARQQEALLGKFRHGERVEDLARRLGIEREAAASLLHRARRTFRERFRLRAKALDL